MNKEQFLNELLIAACQDQNYEAAAFLIEQGANANYVDEDGYTPLWEASNHCDIELMILLLEKGAQVNACTAEVSPLHIACDSPFRSLEAIALLVAQGADVNQKDEDGQTPFDRSKISDGEENSLISEFLECAINN